MSDSSQQPLVYVVIVNWNGWRDTLACLESLFASNYPQIKVAVCDNGSGDDSLDRIRAWGQSNVPFMEIERAQAETGVAVAAGTLVLVRNGANLGFAGGSNLGLRLALADPECRFAWLLNNDTAVAPATLGHMVQRLVETPGAGACGATLVDFAPPHRVQALAGASYHSWLGTIGPIGAGDRPEQRPPMSVVEAQLDYIVGASMLVTRAWLEQVGLLSEDYFLYYEEIDWAARAGRRFRQVWARDAIVYHKQGASIGGPAGSARIDGLALRNRLRFTRRHRPWALPTVWLGLVGALGLRIARRQWRRVPTVLAVLCGRWRWQT